MFSSVFVFIVWFASFQCTRRISVYRSTRLIFERQPLFRKSRTLIIIIIVRSILKVVCNKRFLPLYACTHFLTEIAVIWPIQFFSACNAYIHNIISLAVRVVVTVAGCFACHDDCSTPFRNTPMSVKFYLIPITPVGI